jgi:thiol-disulfide isomerase/thioredoxin
VKRDPVVLIVVAMIVSLMLVFGFNLARHSPSPESAAAARMKGKAARDFTLQSLEGKTVRLSDFRGKAVLLNFWATWCEPCKIEMPWLVDLQKKYGSQGLQIVGIAMDDTDEKTISSFAHKMGVNYPIVLGTEKVADLYGGIDGMPTLFFVDRSGKIVDHELGLRGIDVIEGNIKKSLGQTEASRTASAQ